MDRMRRIFLIGLFPFSLLGVEVVRVNRDTVGLFEKFEAVIDVGGIVYENPYDPDVVDLLAVFTAPSGKIYSIFGFYDDYRRAAAWKIRFSPDELGEWRYGVTLKDHRGTATSPGYRFFVTPSPHHGWIRVSEINPHYLQYADGTPFYGVGMYTPWGERVETFDRLRSFGGNTFAIWNITYGGMVNGYGLIEETLGRYNQVKCGKIDTLLIVAEARDLVMMFCIWPHDLFSNTVWAHQWHLNPYRFICDVKDVYSDSLCWEYQKKQYRYLIARFGYSRALGIWELINEINGTDGWVAGRQDEALEWVRKTADFFRTHDPYRRPTTASRSGGYSEYWPAMYEQIDLPNIHLYEQQGWPTPYPSNPLRSSLKNYADATKRFWDRFEKPAIFGEAGADLARVPPRTPDYLAMYHNALWACLTNGLAATPYWWTFTDPIRDVERIQMKHLSTFVSDIDFIRESRVHFRAETAQYDLYGMGGDASAFGWIREAEGGDVAGLSFEIRGILDPSIRAVSIRYFDPWNGQDLATRIRPHVDHRIRETIPLFGRVLPDVAFQIQPAQGGDTPARLELSCESQTVWNIDTLRIPIACYLIDAEGRFCPRATATVSIGLEGPAVLEGEEVRQAEEGAMTFSIRLSGSSGVIRLVADSPGLKPDTLAITVKDRFLIDDFESYPSEASIGETWLAKGGTSVRVFLDPEKKKAGAYGMRVEYGIGAGYRPTAILERSLDQDFSGAQGLAVWLTPDGSGRDLEIRLTQTVRSYWNYRLRLTGTDSATWVIPLDAFIPRDPTVPLDPARLTALRLTVERGEGSDGVGVFFMDEIRLVKTVPTTVFHPKGSPDRFSLHPLYPNPFNPATRIVFELPRRAEVRLSVFNTRGQEVALLMTGELEAGIHTLLWEAPRDVASGVYFFQLRTEGARTVRKALLLR